MPDVLHLSRRWLLRARSDHPLVPWLLTTAALLLLCRYGIDTDMLFDRACRLDHQFGNMQFDEIIVTFLFLSMGWLMVAIARGVRLQREVTRREAAERNALQLARHDPLTGLVNRRVFMEELDTAVEMADPFVTLVLDADGFKAINDLHGHAAGDELLRVLGERMRRVLPEQATVARLGGDEFAALLRLDLGPPLLISLIERLSGELKAPFNYKGLPISVSASIGVSGFPSDGQSANSLLNAADIAMYESKSNAKSGYRFFEAMMESERMERLRRAEELSQATAAGEIVPYYQPVVSLSTGEICGFEILARWIHPRLGLLAPAEFIELAEQTGQITPLTESLLKRAVGEITAFPDHYWFALNISPVQLAEPQLAERLIGIVTRGGVATSRLEIEITEDALMDDIDLAEGVLAKFRASGMSIALDDFGTGFSSLSSLRRLRFDKIKIDRSFVQNVETSEESLKLIEVILLLASRFDPRVTAEGIETEGMAAMLSSRGCTQGQGYFYGRPVPCSEAMSHCLRPGALAA